MIAIPTMLASRAGQLLSLLVLVLLLLLGLFSWHSAQCGKAYDAGYQAAINAAAENISAEVQIDMLAAQENSAKVEKEVRVVTKVVQETLHDIQYIESDCTNVGPDVLRLLNAPVEATNSSLHLQ